jgi:prepilin-type N-terminal cleavage/methylation domain-containing protein/prepilin-type processing-associated H-X9-DG protein
MRSRRCRGVTLLELMVAILVIAVGLAVIVTMLPEKRGCVVRANCQNNLRFIGLAMVNYETTHNRFPNAGTFHDDPVIHQGDPYRSEIYLAMTAPGATPGQADSWLHSWVVDLLPYLDEQDMYNAWALEESYLSTVSPDPAQPSNAVIASSGIGILRCPNDPTAQPGKGNLSYVVNGGFARWPAVPAGWSGSPRDGRAANGGVLEWTAPGGTWRDSQALGKTLGVMFPGTQTGDQPWDIATRPADLVDGASTTLLVAENTLVGDSNGTPYSGGMETNWACPLPNFTMFLGSDDVCRTSRSANDCLGGQLATGPKGATGKGWARANQRGTYENINFGQGLTVEGSFPFANSAHERGTNFVFCDGAVRYISSTIDGAVYAGLITPAGTRLPQPMRQGLVDVNTLNE